MQSPQLPEQWVEHVVCCTSADAQRIPHPHLHMQGAYNTRHNIGADVLFWSYGETLCSKQGLYTTRLQLTEVVGRLILNGQAMKLCKLVMMLCMLGWNVKLFFEGLRWLLPMCLDPMLTIYWDSLSADMGVS